MVLSWAELRELQEACFADDLELREAMLEWTVARATRFFESGGIGEAQDVSAALVESILVEHANRPYLPYDNRRPLSTEWPEVYEVLHSPCVAARAAVG